MRLLYSFLYTCAFVVALPYFLISGLLQGKYLRTASQRLGNIPVRSDRRSIWIHAVSVGELLATKSLIKMLQHSIPDVPLFVSTTTITGQKLAREVLPDATFYFPFDWSWSIRKVIRQIQPMLVLVLETEIWPNFLWTLQRQKIPAVLVNGRISDRSMARYKLVRRWMPTFSESWMQTSLDAERMKALGADSVFVMGNMKYDFQPTPLSTDLSKRILQWKGKELLWIAGSTMEGEERFILEAYQHLKSEFQLKLLLAVRHPERFSAVAALLSEMRFPFARRSEENFDDAGVLLLDSIGELAGAYEFADVVLIGGTLLENGGGHNPIEPAYFAKAILSGPHFIHFRNVFEDFQRHNAILITSDIVSALRDLLSSEEKRRRMGEAGREILQRNMGATKTVVEMVHRILQENSKSSQAPVLN